MSGVSNNELNNRIYKSIKKVDHDFYIGNIDIVHQETHKGNFYTVEYLFTNVADDAYATMVIAPQGETTAHVQIFYATSGKTYLTSWTDSTFSNMGTELIPFNRNMLSLTNAKSKIYVQPTIIDAGTQRGSMLSGSGANPASQAGGTGGGRNETIVPFGEVLMFRIQNKSGAVGDIGIGFSFYEV